MNAPLNRAAFDGTLYETPVAVALAARREHVFGLHPALHVATFAGFFAYLGIMWAAFGHAELVLPFAIFVVFLGGAYMTPAMWARVAGPAEGPSWSEFLRDGTVCATGHVSAGSAIVQVLIMPAMLLFWGVAVAAIAATV